MAGSTPSKDDMGKAIGFLLFGVAGGLGLDLCAKALLVNYSLSQFIFLRSTFGLLILLSVARWYGGYGNLRTRNWHWHLLRTLLSCGAMFGFFYGLSRMPLVNALTIAFTAPLMVTAMSVPFLGEQVGWRRWLAVIVGFAGVLLVLRPGSGLVTPASLAVLFAATCYAGLAITARRMAAEESSFALSVYVMSGPLLMSGLLLQENYATPDASGWLLFVLAGACSACAWIGIVGGYRRAPPVVLAPFEYTALIGAAIAGYWIWNEVPDNWVIAGGAVIIGSGLYVVHREVGGGAPVRYLRALTASASATVMRRVRRSESPGDQAPGPDV
ncbi:DMT family transporter [Woeseia oceani]|nr:DMT family transporter [Woeseia oceani]